MHLAKIIRSTAGFTPWRFAVGLMLTVCGCGRDGPTPDGLTQVDVAGAPAGQLTDAAPAPPPQAPQGLDPSAQERTRQILRSIQDRHSCNPIMGCPPALELMQLGKDVVPHLIAAISGAPQDDGHWVPKLIELLGQLDDDRVVPLLEQLLVDTRWSVRARAAQALARLRRPETLRAVRDAVQRAGKDTDLPMLAAALLAEQRLAPTDPRPRAALATVLPADEASLGKLNAGWLAFVAEVLGEARATEALPALRVLARHRSRFARSAAVRALRALHDREAIPILVARLDDELPSVRRLAMAALRTITGEKTPATEADWKAWCERTSCQVPTSPVEPDK